MIDKWSNILSDIINLEVSNFCIMRCHILHFYSISVLEECFVLGDSVDPDEMPHNVKKLKTLLNTFKNYHLLLHFLILLQMLLDE